MNNSEPKTRPNDLLVGHEEEEVRDDGVSPYLHVYWRLKFIEKQRKREREREKSNKLLMENVLSFLFPEGKSPLKKRKNGMEAPPGFRVHVHACVCVAMYNMLCNICV